MNKKIFLIFSLLFISIFMACNMTETINEITSYENNIETKLVEKKKTSLIINIINKASNIILEIDEYKIVGIEGIDTIFKTKQIINYGEIVTLNSFDINEQILDNNIKVILLAKLITNTNYIMYDDLIYIPISSNIKEGENVLNLELYGGCNWFDKNGNKLLHQINFNVTVNNWYEHENTVIFN